MKISLAALQEIIKHELDNLQEELSPIQLQVNLEDIAQNGRDVNVKIKKEADRERRNALYGERSALVGILKQEWNRLGEILRNTTDPPIRTQLKEMQDKILETASQDVMGWKFTSLDVFMTARTIYGGDPKRRSGGLGT